MAGTPKYKIYDNDGQYVASTKSADDAAILVVIGYSDKGTVRLGHGQILYTAGTDGHTTDSYDDVAAIILRREQQIMEAAYKKVHGALPADYAPAEG